MLFNHNQVDFRFPHAGVFYALILALIYLPINSITWDVEQVKDFVEDVKNQYEIGKAERIFFVLLFAGFVLLVLVAKYNNGTLFR